MLQISRCRLLVASGFTVLCSNTTTSQMMLTERVADVACLRRQTINYGVPFNVAMVFCKSKLPDLTGDLQLQEHAYAWKIPFQILPKADAEIKAYTVIRSSIRVRTSLVLTRYSTSKAAFKLNPGRACSLA